MSDTNYYWRVNAFTHTHAHVHAAPNPTILLGVDVSYGNRIGGVTRLLTFVVYHVRERERESEVLLVHRRVNTIEGRLGLRYNATLARVV